MLRIIVFMLPFVLVIATLLYALIRTIGRVWLQHRVRMTLLEQLERQPELLEQWHQMDSLLAEPPAVQTNTYMPDFILTGACLAVVGILTAFVAAVIGGSQTATAAYFGGVICVCLGFIIGMVGLLTRYLNHHPADRFPQK